MGRKQDQLDKLALALSESQQVNWDQALGDSTDIQESRLIRNLKLISAVGEAHRRAMAEARGKDLPFPRWGHLELIEKIGEGSYGQVFRARDHTLGRDVALKLFPKDDSRDPARAATLLDEARRLARIRHENVVRVHGAEVHHGRLGFWMELVPGLALDQVLEQEGPLSEKEAAEAGLAVARALAAVHGANLLHRDIKSSNVVRGDDGRIYLVDFGAGISSEEGSGRHLQLVGTPFYMAPELFRGAPSSVRSDIHSLGVLLFHLVSKRYPVEADTLEALRVRHEMGARKPLAEVAPGLSGKFRTLVERCLDPDPERRFASAPEVVTALEQLVGPGLRLIRNPLVWIGASLIVASVTVGAFLLRPSPSPGTLEVGRVFQLTTTGKGGLPTWSPDGNWIAYSQYDGATSEIWVADPSGNDRRLILSSSIDTVPWGWAPDSKAVIAHTAQYKVILVPIDGNPPRVLVESAAFGDLSSDGRQLLYADRRPEAGKGISILDLQTKNISLLVSPPPPGNVIYKPKWSPDGKRLTFIRWNGQGHDLWIANADGSSIRQIDTGEAKPAGNYMWHPDGKAVICGAEFEERSGIWRFPVDSGTPTLLVSDLNNLVHVTVSPDGHGIAAAVQRDLGKVAILNLDDGTEIYPIEGTAATQSPSFSSNGRSLLYQRLVNGRWQAWEQSLNEAGGSRALLTEPGVSHLFPRMTKHGMIHIRSGVGSVSVFGRPTWARTLYRSDGTRAEPQPMFEGFNIDFVAASIEYSNFIAFAAQEPDSGLGQIVCLWRPGMSPTELFRDKPGDQFSALSMGRDDKEVLALRFRRKMPIVLAALREGAQPESLLTLRSLDDGQNILWGQASLAVAPDRKHLAVLAPCETKARLYLIDLSRIAPHVIRTYDLSGPASAPAWSPDGRRIAVEIPHSEADVAIWWLEPKAKKIS